MCFLYKWCIIYLDLRNSNIVELLGCTTTPVILNLHLFLWDTNIYRPMSSLLRWEGRSICEVAHLAWLGLKMQETTFPVVLLYNKFTKDGFYVR